MPVLKVIRTFLVLLLLYISVASVTIAEDTSDDYLSSEIESGTSHSTISHGGDFPTSNGMSWSSSGHVDSFKSTIISMLDIIDRDLKSKNSDAKSGKLSPNEYAKYTSGIRLMSKDIRDKLDQLEQDINEVPSVSTPEESSAGDAPVIIQASSKGYDVYMDDVFIGKEGTGGDPSDGVFIFNVTGNQIHSIKVLTGSTCKFEKSMYFTSGVLKVINVQTTEALPSGSTGPSTNSPANPPAGDTPVEIQTSLKGYDVYVDDVFIGKEGTGNDMSDGIFDFSVIGNQIHSIKVLTGGTCKFEKSISFISGVPKVILVPTSETSPSDSTVPSTNSPANNITAGDTPVEIHALNLKGYDVEVDNAFIGKEGTGGDQLDGNFTFSVVGNQEHLIKVLTGDTCNFGKSMYFNKGVRKILMVGGQ